MLKISVIIPTYNSWLTLKDCINSILNQTLKPQEIIVIDNDSTDNSGEKVKENFPQIKLVQSNKNLGVSGGRNLGIKAVAKENNYLMFVDHDIVAEKNMIEELIKIAESSEETGIVTPKICYFDNKNIIWSAGTGINLWTGRIFFRGGRDRGQYEEVEEVEVAPAAFLVKKALIKKLKKFDDRYFATYEDTDFCFRAKKNGFKIMYAPRSHAYHKIPQDLEKQILRLLSRTYWIGRNRIIFMKDHGKNFFIFLLFIPLFSLYYLYLSFKYKSLIAWLNFMRGSLDGLFT